MALAAKSTRDKFLVELIKPSHYDDDGYVIQWWRGFIPSNSLSSIYGLVLDAHERRLLGDVHQSCVLRRRTWMPVQLQLLHHHQRAGTQIAVSDRR
jgi:hypothetical protein